jgi:hypothetical protein
MSDNERCEELRRLTAAVEGGAVHVVDSAGRVRR